ncbi:molybdopterin-synthase adenylyltransferase MoeB [Hymenobacter saemangeumensis]|uniref:Molybdopterin-synthase adenylyltransferase MoeB n=1 Tax=Hymenobacter saemangeumensis TaxID=1084522 RepID=A0ABP8I876_9BACT
MPLSPTESQRYLRHLQLPEVGVAGQEKLRAARVLVVGAGGLGCPILQYLAAAGVGTLGIVDADTVALSNLQRQILYGPDDVGQPKAACAAHALARLNPLVSCEVHAVRADLHTVRALVPAYDLVIDGSDNFPTRYLLNDACALFDKPLVSGAIYRFEGQVSVFNYQGGPTYRCLFPTPPGPDEAPDCNATGVLGVLPGLIGCVQATEALKVLLGIGEVLSGRLWVLDTLSFQSRTLKFRRREEQAAITLDTANKADYAELCHAAPARLSPGSLREMLAGPHAPLLLDVREPAEYAAGHLPGALLLPLSELPNRATELPEGPLVVYCQRGGRSARAAALLREELGRAGVQELAGGYEAWLAI